MKTHNTRVNLCAITVILIKITFISNVSADMNCTTTNLSRLESENKELQRIIDTEPENIPFTRIGPDGKKEIGYMGNFNRTIAIATLALNKSNLAVCKSDLERLAEKTKKDVVDEIEGFEVEIEAEISVKKSSNKYQINVSSNIASGTFELLALKQGSKSLKFVLKTDEDGNKKFTSNRNLNGYRLVLKYNGEQINSYSIR